MKRFARWLLSLVVLILLIPVGGFLVYATSVFLPAKSAIDQIIDSAGFEDRHPPANIQALIRASLTTDQKPSGYVAKLLLFKFRVNERGVVEHWLLQWAAWAVMVEIVYDESAVYSLFCTLVSDGKHQGLNGMSSHMFNKPLSDLALGESAQLLAYTGGPNLYRNNPERLQAAKARLLERINR